MDPAFTRFGGGIPENYEHGLGPHIFADFASDLAKRVAASAPRRVLELASGTGILTRSLRDLLGDACDLVATDLNEPMLDVARRKFDPRERVELQQADALALPFADRSFDVVTCQFGVMFFPDKVASYREALRVLSPGGRYIFNVWSSFEHNPFARIAHETVSGCFGGDPPGFYGVPFAYHDRDEIAAELETAGFVGVVAEVERFEKVVADYDRFGRGLVLGNPLIEEIQSRGDVDPEAVRLAITAALRREFGVEPSAMPLQALVVTAERPSSV